MEKKANNWENALIPATSTLQQAIAALDRSGLQIAVVVDENRRLAGTVTDGDVRRALIRQVGLEALITDVMTRSPRTAPAGSSKELLIQLMENHSVSQIPLVAPDGRVVGIETLRGLLAGNRRDNAVFLMAGGFGTRLQPLTDSCPKPLLNIGKKPILEITIENFVRAGFHRFFISTHYLPEMIREHFGDGMRWGITIEYIHESEPLGTGGSLGLLPRDSIHEPMLMMNGDLLTNLDYNKLFEFHSSHDSYATMCVREYEHQVPFGVIANEGISVKTINEKPTFRHFINAGIYVLSPEILDCVARGQRIDMPTILEQQIAAGRTVNMFPIHEYWLDIGRMEDFLRAQDEISELLNG